MIRRVWSDLATFKEARFDTGFNVVLADTTEDSKETESTNGLGKRWSRSDGRFLF